MGVGKYRVDRAGGGCMGGERREGRKWDFHSGETGLSQVGGFIFGVSS